jgi:hypothetical protein
MKNICFALKTILKYTFICHFKMETEYGKMEMKKTLKRMRGNTLILIKVEILSIFTRIYFSI